MFAEIDTSLLIGLILALAATGILGGLLAGLLGVGGGIVIVPVLYNILSYFDVGDDIRMHVAVGTSLATIIPTSLASAYSHNKKGAIDWSLVKSWGGWILLGVLGGTVVAGLTDAFVLTLVFAVLALIVAANMAFRPDDLQVSGSLPKAPLKQLLALFIGWFSAMMGIGGGTFAVPILTLFKYPIRKAVGTASFIGLIIAVPGTIGFLISGYHVPDLPVGNLGYVNGFGILIIAPMTVLCAPLGARWAHRINTGLLKKLFAFFLFATSARMFYGLLS